MSAEREALAEVIARHQRLLLSGGACLCDEWPPVDNRDVTWMDHLADAVLAHQEADRTQAEPLVSVLRLIGRAPVVVGIYTSLADAEAAAVRDAGCGIQWTHHGMALTGRLDGHETDAYLLEPHDVLAHQQERGNQQPRIQWGNSEEWPQELRDLIERTRQAGWRQGVSDERQHRADETKDQADQARTCGTCGLDRDMAPLEWCTSASFHQQEHAGITATEWAIEYEGQRYPTDAQATRADAEHDLSLFQSVGGKPTEGRVIYRVVGAWTPVEDGAQ